MKLIEHTLDLRGPGCYGKSARPRAIGAVLTLVEPTVRESVRMSVLHSSRRVGRPMKELRAAWDIRFGGQSEGPDDSTRLHFEAPALGDAAPRLFEQNMFWDDGLKPDVTAFDLVGDVLRDVAKRAKESERYDADLLNRIARFDVALRRGVDSIRLAGHHMVGKRSPVIDSKITESARSLVSETPKPRRARVAGVLDMIRVSDRVFELLLQDKVRLRAVWTQPTVVHLAEYLNQQVVIEGQAVFRPSGSLLRVDTSAISRASDSDTFFSKVPQPMGDRKLAERSRQPQRAHAGASAIYGKWPGEETEEELLAALRGMRE